jgi:asparagine synthase (glutamine-hydrolysing)
MSGIAGIVHFDGQPVERLQIGTMTTAMKHRGPDGVGHWQNRNVALGQCQMRTTSAFSGDSQPLMNDDGLAVLVIDGRIDNRKALRERLLKSGAFLRTTSDAELVMRAYEAWGTDCVDQMQGDFALALWDAGKKQLFCARDRLGNKPFYYYWNGRSFAFASDVHALLALPWLETRFNEGMPVEYLTMEWLSRDETFWTGIMRLPAANTMMVNERGSTSSEYWTPDPWLKLPCSSENDYVDHYRDLLTQIVSEMSTSDHPVACEVSGGLDSSAIFSVAEDLRKKGQLPAPGIDGYVLNFEGVPDADELAYARAVGAFHARTIHEVEPTHKPLTWFRETAQQYGCFPGYPNGIMGLGIRERARLAGSRVLLVGVGGDEWIDGCRTYYAEAIRDGEWREFKNSLAADISAHGMGRTLWWMLRRNTVPALPESVKNVLRALRPRTRSQGVDVEAWLSVSMRQLLVERREKYSMPRLQSYARLGQVSQFAQLHAPYSVLARESEERLAALIGMELRRPFWDARLVQFAFATPDWIKVRGNTGKSMHRKAMAGLLPDVVLQRHSKADFMNTFRVYWPELRQAVNDIARAHEPHGSPVVPGKVSKLYEQGSLGHAYGWPEWLLWGLFGSECVRK